MGPVEQDSKALTQDEAKREFDVDVAEANAGREEVINVDEENELGVDMAEANAGGGEVVNVDEENGNGEEKNSGESAAEDEDKVSARGSDQMEEDFFQEPDANKQIKTPMRKRRKPEGTKKLRSKGESVVYPKPLLG